VTRLLSALREALSMLELDRAHDLLDVGCGNGLLDVVLCGGCRTVTAVEPVPELAALARQNLSACANVQVIEGDARAIPARDASFDRVMLINVVQLIPPSELRGVLRELRRVMRLGARLAVASIPDADRRDAFLRPYLDAVRAAAHLSAEEKAAIIERNERAHWYHADYMIDAFESAGLSVRVASLPADDPDADHRFSLVAHVPRTTCVAEPRATSGKFESDDEARAPGPPPVMILE
jgi:SAM-dependent methyltransferase